MIYICSQLANFRYLAKLYREDKGFMVRGCNVDGKMDWIRSSP